MRSLVLEALDFIVHIIISACQYTPNSPEACWVQETIETWARQKGIIADSYTLPKNLYRNVNLPPFGRMILDFGVIYKRRRLNFVLHEINDLYPGVSSDQAGVADSASLDLLKVKIHECIDELSIFDNIDFLSRQAIAACQDIFLEKGAERRIALFEPSRFEEISKLIERLAQECDLARTADNADAVLASPLVLNLAEPSRNAILTGYLGYFFWDIILRPAMSALSLDSDAGPIEEILVDRISPEDASSLMLDGQKNMLLGKSLASFGGFLGRSIRESDYLWGRLHAVDRLFDILLSTVPVNIRDNFNINALKKRAFKRVLEEEEQRLHAVPALMAKLREAVE